MGNVKTMMDAKMKGMVMAAMAGLCLVLGIIAALGSTWLVPTGDDAEELEDMDSDAGAGLTSSWSTTETGKNLTNVRQAKITSRKWMIISKLNVTVKS